MADELRTTLQRISAKAHLLTERYKRAVSDKRQADERIRALELEVQSQRHRIEELSQQVEYLKIASTVAITRDDIANSRALLSGLVREIDNCIKDLSD